MPRFPSVRPFPRIPRARALALSLAFVSLAGILAGNAQAAWVSANAPSPKPLLSRAVRGNAVSEHASVRVLVGLKMRDAESLDSVTKGMRTPGSPVYGQTMTAAEFDARYAPTAAQAHAVATYLAGAGFTNIAIPADRLYVTAEGSPAAIRNAFNTTLATYTLNGRSVFANITDAQVPDSLNGTVLQVVGLNNVAPMQPHIKHHVDVASGAKPNAGSPALLLEYTAPEFQIAYDAGTTPTASQTTIAIFAEGDLTQVLLDLRTAEANNMQPQVPYEVRQIGPQSGDTSGADEFDLDTQMSSGMAQEVAKMVIYDTTSLNDVDLIPSFNQFVLDNDSQAGSASFGGCELTEMLAGAIPTYDQIFHKAFVQGQTVFASAGDNGGACAELVATGVPDTGVVSGQNYPCSSPYVMCVGGTTLTTDAEYNYITEIAWDSTGGGTSEVEPPEFWQMGIVPTSAVTTPSTPVEGSITVTLYKGVPDVAMDADNQLSPASVVVDGAAEGVGGTSLSSPLALGVWARFESAHCNTLGNAAPLLYAFAVGTDATTATLPSVGGGFHDITVGTNGLYTALPGWDYVTGLGTFDISLTNAALGSGCGTFSSTTGGTSGGTTGGTSTGGTSTGGTSTGGTSTGGTGGGSSGGTSSGSSSTGGTSGGSDAAATDGSTSGAFGLPVLLPLLGLAAFRRRRRR